MSGRASKRRRRRPLVYSSDTAAEQRLLQAALQNSKLDQRRTDMQVPYGPVFYPTIADMEGNPLEYIAKIRPMAERYGICKIVPPKEWKPPLALDTILDSTTRKFPTKLQQLHRLQEGVAFGDGVDYTPSEYEQVACRQCQAYQTTHYPHHALLNRHKQHLHNNDSTSEDDKRLFVPSNLERDYWDMVEQMSAQPPKLAVEYGNDVDTQIFGSGFELSRRGRSIVSDGNNKMEDSLSEPEFGTLEYYRETWWNLNNLPSAPNSVLRHVKVGINGVNVPWMYYGSLFATFCWHNEDNYLYSINYHHRGAPKQWYGVPGHEEAANGLERVFKGYLNMKMREVPDLLHHITTMFSPRLLQNAQVPVYKLEQYEGEFVVTFPRSFHSGFSYGPNVGEAVNFATHDWIAHGADANERYRSFARAAVFSHDRLTFTMANHVEEQTSYANCQLLLQELERVVEEELRLRQQLAEAGVRNVSHLIDLPKNRLDQLDEYSAAYDDKRLCHACKHVCFFSAVACECSQSKVSCLRHSHYMCRCPTDRKYFMLWSPEQELTDTLERVRQHCAALKETCPEEAQATVSQEQEPLPKVAPGVERDLAMHKDYEISMDPFLTDSYVSAREKAEQAALLQKETNEEEQAVEKEVVKEEEIKKEEPSSISSVVLDESVLEQQDNDDDEIKIVGVTGPTV